MEDLTHSSFRQAMPPVQRGDVADYLDPAFVEGDEVTLHDYGRVVRKHLWLIAACCFGTILVTALVVLMTFPIYTAETTLLIERQAPQVLNIREFLAEPSTVSKEKEDEFYKTQYEILKSR